MSKLYLCANKQELCYRISSKAENYDSNTKDY